ncbi:YHYH domain-containing protein [Sulfurimonas sp.]|nr:YHYH domain-containing protein [Sulfurimonas sp.]
MKKIVLLLVMGFGLVGAHSGGTDSRGCHTNSQTGDYHCHKSEVNPLLAHSGGTNAYGCHTNSKTGDYHCHKTNVDLLKCDTVSKNDSSHKQHTHEKHKHTNS